MSGVFFRDAREILELQDHRLYIAMAEACRLRELKHGRSVNLCWIVNAKSGCCDQNCGFCAQSSVSKAEINKYPLIGTDEIFSAAVQAAESGATRFSIVTSGGAVRLGKELDSILAAAENIVTRTGLSVCASLGCIESEALRLLKNSGVTRYHHNMETAESYWQKVCSSRSYEESRRVVRAAKEQGLEVCSGGIFGMGETLDQRIELLEEIRALPVDAVALNFFVPIEGTPLAQTAPIQPLDCLRLIIAARMMMPKREIRICGGREKNMGELQALVLPSGASGLMIGGYLTTPGRAPADDIRLIESLGFEPEVVPNDRITLDVTGNGDDRDQIP